MDTPEDRPPAQQLIQQALDHIEQVIEAVANAAYAAGFEDGHYKAAQAMREGVERVADRTADRLTGRPANQRPLQIEANVTEAQRRILDTVAQYEQGISAHEYRKQTGHADVGLYKLARKGLLRKEGSRFFLPR